MKENLRKILGYAIIAFGALTLISGLAYRILEDNPKYELYAIIAFFVFAGIFLIVVIVESCLVASERKKARAKMVQKVRDETGLEPTSFTISYKDIFGYGQLVGTFLFLSAPLPPSIVMMAVSLTLGYKDGKPLEPWAFPTFMTGFIVCLLYVVFLSVIAILHYQQYRFLKKSVIGTIGGIEVFDGVNGEIAKALPFYSSMLVNREHPHDFPFLAGYDRVYVKTAEEGNLVRVFAFFMFPTPSMRHFVKKQKKYAGRLLTLNDGRAILVASRTENKKIIKEEKGSR